MREAREERLIRSDNMHPRTRFQLTKKTQKKNRAPKITKLTQTSLDNKNIKRKKRKKKIAPPPMLQDTTGPKNTDRVTPNIAVSSLFSFRYISLKRWGGRAFLKSRFSFFLVAFFKVALFFHTYRV